MTDIQGNKGDIIVVRQVQDAGIQRNAEIADQDKQTDRAYQPCVRMARFCTCMKRH